MNPDTDFCFKQHNGKNFNEKNADTEVVLGCKFSYLERERTHLFLKCKSIADWVS